MAAEARVSWGGGEKNSKLGRASRVVVFDEG